MIGFIKGQSEATSKEAARFGTRKACLPVFQLIDICTEATESRSRLRSLRYSPVIHNPRGDFTRTVQIEHSSSNPLVWVFIKGMEHTRMRAVQNLELFEGDNEYIQDKTCIRGKVQHTNVEVLISSVINELHNQLYFANTSGQYWYTVLSVCVCRMQELVSANGVAYRVQYTLLMPEH